ncbi:hypothetical protein EO98_19450 [Methanosarcina sp. 2.H.T.1A.6]|uniref:hypothetical protein n=1 Tax=unclassified Methanosarcina TaxID=2644672 RepID=UPI0006228FCF|nr:MULTISPECIES: hypothetical protein [unclassified Methanosarcina]KKG10909.1 hypothetical protein EO97_03390 [Methanosarcina sp. 2.H.T.1A.15]KKG17831.1 hypothetical protein EO94_14880 [Methanosarcina sp. 2.H.T.1A.3]KKG19428.1 hypothetical protein EO98_19450 [Methanosarcina sp. 2.H.T.1A.6]KKG27478.1 hypothetical protein EO96_10825 [Methanosarcina sp. 2.H.T.1A.8]
MATFWSVSHTLGTKEKVFSWRIDSRGNIFIKRKFRNGCFPRIDKISCSHLDKLQGFMQDREWKYLANDAAKLYMGTEKDGIGKFLYRLRPEIPYAQLSSQLAAIFYHSEVWEWNEQKRGMKFLLLPGNWQEKTAHYYRNSLALKNEGTFIDEFSESGAKVEQGQEQEELQETLNESLPGEAVPKIEQTKLSTFFGF